MKENRVKIRIFKTPSKNKPNRVHVGIPDALKLDSGITEIELKQTEVLSAPKNIADLSKNPIVVPNKSLNAFKNVGVSELSPGFKMTGVVKGTVSSLQPALEIEEIVIPEDFDHLDDASAWLVNGYNSAYKLSDADFDVLPGDKNLPMQTVYELIIKGNKLTVKYEPPIDRIRVYYKRVYSNSRLEAFWVPLVILDKESDPFEFLLPGKYEIRVVPFHGSKQMASFKEYEIEYEEEESFEWSAIQLGLNRYQIRIEGLLGNAISELDVFENGKRLSTQKLRLDKDGRVEKSFTISGVSNSKNPILELKYYRRNGTFKSLVEIQKRKLFPTVAIEPIALKINKIDKNSFELTINDSQNILYTATNVITPYAGSEWQKAIQSHKYMAFISIKRHQDGFVTDYGYYPINITAGDEPKFLSSPPFTDTVEKISDGFSFVFEDTKKFRQIKGLDDPNLEKKIAYEFRLLYWTVGIEDCLNTGIDYVFTKETPILVKNQRRAYKYSYSVWKEEHPVRKYRNRIPVDVEYAYMQDHIDNSFSPVGYVLSSSPQPIVETFNVTLESKGWRVLYFYNDKDDEIQTFPYSSFSISIPQSSQLAINKIKIYIENSESSNILLGEYHPGDTIDLIDFLGYYEARRFVTKTIDVQSEISNAVSLSRSGARHNPIGLSKPKKTRLAMLDTPSRMANTTKKKNAIKKNNTTMNNKITEVIEVGVLSYRVDIIYKNGKVSTLKHSEDIENIPKLPPEPEDNQSVAIGNKTISGGLQVANTSIVSKISSALQKIPIKRISKAGGR